MNLKLSLFKDTSCKVELLKENYVFSQRALKWAMAKGRMSVKKNSDLLMTFFREGGGFVKNWVPFI